MSPKELINRYRIEWLYHFTDVTNIKSIRCEGLYSLELLRNFKRIPERPGGDKLSHRLDIEKRMDHFVHLSFVPDHPMKFCAEKDGRIGPVRVLRIKPSVLEGSRVRIAPDVANKKDIACYSVEESVEHIDYEVMYDYTDWKDPQIQERRRKAKRAEVLIPVKVPKELIDFDFDG